MDRLIERKPSSKRKYIVLAAVIAIITLGVFLGSFPKKSQIAVDIDGLTISEVKRTSDQNFIPINASVRGSDTTFIDTTEGGTVEAILAENGQVLEAGQPLVRLVNIGLQLNVIEKEAQITEQISNLYNIKINLQNTKLRNEVDVENSKFSVQRLKQRLDRRISDDARLGIPEEEIEELRAELSYQKSLLDTYESHKSENDKLRNIQSTKIDDLFSKLDENLEFTRNTLESLLVKAPRAGELTSFNLNIGQSIDPGTRVGQINNSSGRELSAMVDEFYIRDIKIGMRANFTLGNRTIDSVVVKVLPQVENGQFEVIFSIKPSDMDSTALGQSLNGKLFVQDRLVNALTLKNGPFFIETKGKWVFVVSPDLKSAEKRMIEFTSKNPDFIFLEKGLKEGEKVITSSYKNLKDYQSLRIEN